MIVNLIPACISKFAIVLIRVPGSFQVCCKDLWFLESEKPAAPTRVQLVRASTTTLEVCWGGVPTAEQYLLQVQKYDIPLPPPPPATAAPPTPVVQTPAPVAVAAPQVHQAPTTPAQSMAQIATPVTMQTVTSMGQKIHAQTNVTPITTMTPLSATKVHTR